MTPIVDDPEFAAFWAAYPRRIDKGHARYAFKTARKKASFEDIMRGLAAYRFDPRPEYRPHPRTWLVGERWIIEDDEEFDPVLRAAGLRPSDFVNGA